MLLGLAPNTARIVRNDGTEEDIPLEQVQPGDTLRIRPGEKILVDGTVIDGESNVDESMVTGEPIPVAKLAGEKLIGTIAGTSGLWVTCALMVSKGAHRVCQQECAFKCRKNGRMKNWKKGSES